MHRTIMCTLTKSACGFCQCGMILCRSGMEDENVTLAIDMQLFTDSSGLCYAGYYEGKWFAEPWPANMPKLGSQDMSIAYYELVSIVVLPCFGHTNGSGNAYCFV